MFNFNLCNVLGLYGWIDHSLCWRAPPWV